MKQLGLFLMCFYTFNLFSQDLSNIKDTKPVTFGGGLNLQTGFYAINGAKARQPAFNYLISGSPTLTVYGVSLPFSFTFSNYQRDFRQPFNQFGLSPTYKWVTLHAGYRNISYSQFGMAGFTILGGGIELKPKKFRFAFLYGRSQKAIADDTSKSIETNLNDIRYPAYKRMIATLKLGYGSENNFIDLNILHGKDDSTSIPFRPLTTSVLPSKNLVFDLANKLSFFEKKLVWQAEGAISAYTRDIGFEPVDAKNAFVNKFLSPNVTTQLFTAFETKLDYNIKDFGIGAKFRKVSPDYQSMGAYYFQSDLQQILGNIKFSLLKSKIRFAGSLGIQKDNLLNKKLATTQRNIYNGNLSLNPNTKFGVDISVANFGTSQRAGTRNLSDTAKINQINSSFTLAPRYIISNNNSVVVWQAILGQQHLNDKNRFTEGYTEVNMLFGNLIWMKNILKTLSNYSLGLNYNESKNTIGKISLTGATAGLSKTSKDQKLNQSINTGLNATFFQGEYNGFVGNLQYVLGYQLHKKHKVSFTANALVNESKNASAGASFQEYFVRLNYGITF